MLKKSPDIADKRDIAEAQRGHHRQGPIHSGDPGMVTPFGVQHDHVKKHRVENDENQQHQILEQCADTLACAGFAEEVGNLAAQKLHLVASRLNIGGGA